MGEQENCVRVTRVAAAKNRAASSMFGGDTQPNKKRVVLGELTNVATAANQGGSEVQKPKTRAKKEQQQQRIEMYGCSESEEHIKIEYHKFDKNYLCSGASFVPKNEGQQEDDGWLICFVHNEETDISQVHIIDAKELESEPVAKIRLPHRVPYGFHGTYISNSMQQ